MRDDLSILQVCTNDVGGGAEKIAFDLYRTYRQMGYASAMAVGNKRGDDPGVFRIPNTEHRNPWAKLLAPERRVATLINGHVPGAWRVTRRLAMLSEPSRLVDECRGREDFDFPGTGHLLDMVSPRPDIVHCHNLHGGYFDLRQLPEISHRVPVVVTLHDAWLLSGHCAHSFACERWKTGCGHCPDLSIYPPIRRDSTAENCRAKADIYWRSRLYVAAPCQWLLEKAKQSMLHAGMAESRVIPNGVDLRVFHPGDRSRTRQELNLPVDARIMLFVASGIRKNVWKDYETLRKAIAIVAGSHADRPLLCMALGEMAPPQKIGSARIVFVPYEKDPAVVARYYRAADVYVHAARAETFPNTILEAMASGTPVVASAVGGIPEQIDNGRTGLLAGPGDAESMACCIDRVLSNDDLRKDIGNNAAEKARTEYDLRASANSYLRWYREIVEKFDESKS